MDDELARQSEENRYRFVKTDLQICATALSLGTFELSVGNTDHAYAEVASVEKAIAAIEHLLPSISPEHRREVEPELAGIKSGFAGFRAVLGLPTGS